MSTSTGAWPGCGLAGRAAVRHASAVRLRTALGREHHDLRLVRSRAKVFGDRESRYPDDLPTTLHNGNAPPFLGRGFVVGEDVLQGLGPVERRRVHAVALGPRPDRERL